MPGSRAASGSVTHADPNQTDLIGMIVMEQALALTRSLGGRWHGSHGMAHCPAHDDRTPSLAINERDGKVLFCCHAGCSQSDVLAALKAQGRWDGNAPGPSPQVTRAQVDSERIGMARKVWASCRKGDRVATYLNARGITLPVLPTLRFHPALLHNPTGLHLPAMVAAIQGTNGSIVAVQRTYLTGDCDRKAGVSSPKMTLGPFMDGAVRLGPAGEALGIAEGIETGLSAMQLHDVPVWAACGSRMHRVSLPDCVREVHVFADNGEPGHAAAEKAADRFTGEGRRVLIRYPVEQFGDWNDALRIGGAA